MCQNTRLNVFERKLYSPAIIHEYREADWLVPAGGMLAIGAPPFSWIPQPITAVSPVLCNCSISIWEGESETRKESVRNDASFFLLFLYVLKKKTLNTLCLFSVTKQQAACHTAQRERVPSSFHLKQAVSQSWFVQREDSTDIF